MRTKRRPADTMASSRFIRGIYNYCDRWCERCALTSRCLVYATERQQEEDDPASRDITNQAFWKRLEKIFGETQAMLEEMAKKYDAEIEPLDQEAEVDLARHEALVQSDPCAMAGSAYAASVGTWLEQAEPRLKEHEDMLQRQQEMGLPGADPEGEARRLTDALEVIQWYQHQIGIKLMRAAGSKHDADAFDQSDADGSAKVAMIGADRSLAAWSEVLRQLPDEEDRILPILAALSRLRRSVDTAYPDARAFVRPGFDTAEGKS